MISTYGYSHDLSWLTQLDWALLQLRTNYFTCGDRNCDNEHICHWIFTCVCHTSRLLWWVFTFQKSIPKKRLIASPFVEKRWCKLHGEERRGGEYSGQPACKRIGLDGGLRGRLRWANLILVSRRVFVFVFVFVFLSRLEQTVPKMCNNCVFYLFVVFTFCFLSLKVSSSCVQVWTSELCSCYMLIIKSKLMCCSNLCFCA